MEDLDFVLKCLIEHFGQYDLVIDNIRSQWNGVECAIMEKGRSLDGISIDKNFGPPRPRTQPLCSVYLDHREPARVTCARWKEKFGTTRITFNLHDPKSLDKMVAWITYAKKST